MAEYNLAAITRSWAVKQLAMGKKPSDLYALVSDPDKCRERKITPFTGPYTSWYGYMYRIPVEEIKQARLEYMADLDDIDLAHKKMRVIELVTLYDNIKMGKQFDKDKVQAKRLILQDIAKEVGEDAWREAMKARGGDGGLPVTEALMKQVLAVMSQAVDEGEEWQK